MGLTLRKNDPVIVTAGAERGKKGKILRVDLEKSRAYIEGVRVLKRFVRKSRKNPQGGRRHQASRRSGEGTRDDHGPETRHRARQEIDFQF